MTNLTPVKLDLEGSHRNLRREGTPNRVYYFEHGVADSMQVALADRFGLWNSIDPDSPTAEWDRMTAVYRFLGHEYFRVFPPGAQLFSDRAFTAHEIPEPLRGAMFLQLSIDGGQLLRMPQDGTLYILTPTVESNRTGWRIAELEDQGFERMDEPVFQLFQRADAFCAIMRKELKAGETARFGKWAVPVFVPSGGNP